jgi:hypothetical protein
VRKQKRKTDQIATIFFFVACHADWLPAPAYRLGFDAPKGSKTFRERERRTKTTAGAHIANKLELSKRILNILPPEALFPNQSCCGRQQNTQSNSYCFRFHSFIAFVFPTAFYGGNFSSLPRFFPENLVCAAVGIFKRLRCIINRHAPPTHSWKVASGVDSTSEGETQSTLNLNFRQRPHDEMFPSRG